MTYVLSVLSICTALLLVGCVSTVGNTQLANMNSQPFIRGKTTMIEIQQRLGSPSKVDITPDGRIEWVYLYSKNTMDAASLIPIVNIFHMKIDKYITKLVLLFNKQRVLSDYILTHSYQKEKAGLVN